MKEVVVGIPRGMMYARYSTIFRYYFDALGIKTLISEPSTQAIADSGGAVTVDEACLALKLYMGHVRSLIGKCDDILIPRVCSYGRNRETCPRFHALYDMARNIFCDCGQKFICLNIDEMHNQDEKQAFIQLGEALGCGKKEAQQAYIQAKKEDSRQWKLRIEQQNAALKKDGLKILVAAHSYVLEDAYIGNRVANFLQKNGVVIIRADVADRDTAISRSKALSPTCKWEFNREILGGIELYRDQVDGIILMSTFPCGPDAMVNEMLLHKLSGIPILNLVLDGQNGTAGLETRLESYLDIIRFKRGDL